MSSTLRATISQPRSLLSIARLNIAKSRVRPSTWSFVRIDQTCFGRSGGFAPISLPLVPSRALGCGGNKVVLVLHGHTPQLLKMTSMRRVRRRRNHVAFQTNPVVIWLLLWTILVANDPAIVNVPPFLDIRQQRQISNAR